MKSKHKIALAILLAISWVMVVLAPITIASADDYNSSDNVYADIVAENERDDSWREVLHTTVLPIIFSGSTISIIMGIVSVLLLRMRGKAAAEMAKVKEELKSERRINAMCSYENEELRGEMARCRDNIRELTNNSALTSISASLATLLSESALSSERLEQFIRAACMVWSEVPNAVEQLQKLPDINAFRRSVSECERLRQVVMELKGSEADDIIAEAERLSAEGVI